MVHIPIMIERVTEIERSWFFLTAIIPKIKAIILAGNATAAVTSHQWLSKESIFSNSTDITDAAIAIKKNAFNPTDHFPSIVFGINYP